jgi:prepilin-type N-terminal cleavage/methylation domain-containing protein
MIRTSVKTRAGFTLVELLVGVTLSAAVMAAVLSSYIFIGRNLTRISNQQALEVDARRTLAYFNEDVRMAIGLSGAPSVTSVTLEIPTATNSKLVTYTYDSTNQNLLRGMPWSSATSYGAGDSVIHSGSGYRCILPHTNQTPPNATYWIPAAPLLSNLISLSFRYYDLSGQEYVAATLTAGSYLPGIKQIALEFSTQAGTGHNGTQTRIYQAASSRLVVRNRGLLP